LATLGRWTTRPETVLPDAVRLVTTLAASSAARSAGLPRAAALPVHERLASGWGCGPKAADLIRRALVLVADHELNASTYAARVVASTRAPLGACVLAGLAALTGPLHGGMTDAVRTLVRDPGLAGDPEAAVAARLARGERIAGFGHPLYPEGDPRAKALIERLMLPRHWEQLVDTMQAMAGLAPNIDFTLLALERCCRLPRGAAFAIFATGRSVGWIAHALEQWREGALIRPRAVYQPE
jgi:citrate synthase